MRTPSRRALGALLLIVATAPPLAAATRDPFGPDRLAGILEPIRDFFRDAPPPAATDHIVTISSDSRTLTFKLGGDARIDLALTGGRVLIDAHQVGRYAPGGALEGAWQDLLADLARVPTPLAVLRARAWAPVGLTGEEASAALELRRRLVGIAASPANTPEPRAIPAAAAGGLTIDLRSFDDLAGLEPTLWRASQLSGTDLRLTVPDGHAFTGHYSVGTGEELEGHLLVFHGDIDIFGTVRGNVVSVDGDIVVHPGAAVTGSVLAIGGRVRDEGGDIRGASLTLSDPETAVTAPIARATDGWSTALRRGAGLAGVFITLILMGAGLVAFAKPQLEIVADTVSHSFGRAFLAGLLGQILVIPTFGMILVGLALTVVGILLVPFAVAVYALLAVVTLLGGFLAVAHAMGEVRARRRMAVGAIGVATNSYAYVTVGLLASLALWVVWIAFGWVPVAGWLIEVAALLVTWILATVGFGAALLSRLGLKAAFAGRFISPETLTDEYLWATPQFGVPAIQRPAKSQVPPSRTPPPMP
ncbi:MAG: polymer-forming cytoskeletal protein [Gemmatimonadota bacterium]